MGVLTDRPGTLTNDFFVNLLDLGTAVAASGDEFEARDDNGDLRWTGTRADLVFGSNSELRAAGRGLRVRRRAREVRARLRRRVGEGHEPGPLRSQLAVDSAGGMSRPSPRAPLRERELRDEPLELLRRRPTAPRRRGDLLRGGGGLLGRRRTCSADAEDSPRRRRPRRSRRASARRSRRSAATAAAIFSMRALMSSTDSPMRSNASRVCSTVATPSSVRRAPSSTTLTALSVSRWISLDQPGDRRRCVLRLLGELADLVGDDREAAALIAGAGGLDRGVEREQVGLLGDAGDGRRRCRRSARTWGEIADRARHQLEESRTDCMASLADCAASTPSLRELARLLGAVGSSASRSRPTPDRGDDVARPRRGRTRRRAPDARRPGRRR